MRARNAIALASLAALLIPAPASASVGCTLEGDALSLTTSEFAEGVAIARDGRTIEVTDDRMGTPVLCSDPPPTVNTIDTIDYTTAAEETSLYIDLGPGPFTPGASQQADDSEIDFAVSWPFGFLGIGGTEGNDEIHFSELRGRPSGAFALDFDQDVRLDRLGNLLARGLGGHDALFANGALTGKPLRSFVTFEGGSGADFAAGGARPDVLIGGPGGDSMLSLGGGRDEIDCGPGRDTAYVDKRDDVSGCEQIHHDLDVPAP